MATTAPHRCIGHSPFARHRHPDVPLALVAARAAEATRGSALGVGLLAASAMAGLLVGLALTQFWRAVVALGAFGVALIALGAWLAWLDRKGDR